MKDLLQFKLYNPLLFSQKAFGWHKFSSTLSINKMNQMKYAQQTPELNCTDSNFVGKHKTSMLSKKQAAERRAKSVTEKFHLKK